MEPFVSQKNPTSLPTIHVMSDSMGITARSIARAAAVQFGVADPCIEVISKVQSLDEIVTFFEEHREEHVRETGKPDILVFYTLVDRNLARAFADYAAGTNYITAVDVLTPAIDAIEKMTGYCASSAPGMLHVADNLYFQRIEAQEFTIDHDDGRNPQDLTMADIVLIGVSRTSKTPLSIYLSQQGLKVANVPLDPQSEPPREIWDVDKTRLFGLMTTVEVLRDIRKRRIGTGIAAAMAGKYADEEYIYEDLEKARALMRKLNCLVVHTNGRAVEETAQEILRYYERWHPNEFR